MKTFIYILLLASLVSAQSFAQECPGPLQVLDMEEVHPACGSTSLFEFRVWTERPNSDDVYGWGFLTPDCFQLPSGWTVVSQSGQGNVTHISQPMYQHLIKITPNAFGGSNATASIRTRNLCNPNNPNYSN